jgi:hypothetical protein
MTEYQELKKIVDVEKSKVVTYKSFNFDAFENHKYNRSENPHKINELVHSFEEGYIETVCICKIEEGKIMIYDGGNRKKALEIYNKKHKGSDKYPQLPIVFQLNPNINANDMRRINDCNGSWKLKDFFESYLKEGKKNYEIAQGFQNKYKDIPLAVIIVLLANRPMSHVILDASKKGVLNIPNYEKSIQNADRIMDFLEVDYKKFSHNKSTFYALLKLMRIRGYEHEKFIKRLKNNPKLLYDIGYFSNQRQYGEGFHKAYNYNIGYSKKLNIRGIFNYEVRDWEDKDEDVS